MAREGFTGGYFFLQIHYGMGERVHRGKGCNLIFFLLFFFFLLLKGRGVEVNVFFCLHLTCGRRKGKG